MARRGKKRRSRGLSGGTGESWYNSAQANFDRVRRGNSRGCAAIEHYTDVIAEATVAENMGSVPAAKLVRTATRAQRGAVALCRRGG